MRHKGFTIVELLIVIVVIAILAAISIVAYNGIQARAENTKTLQGVSGFVKVIQGYAASYGTYPITTNYPCLGESSTTCSRMSGTGTCFGSGTTGTNVTYIAELKKIAVSLPSTSGQEVNCGGSKYAGAYSYPSLAGTTNTIAYWLRGDTSCGSVGGSSLLSKSQQDDATFCIINLPTLN